MEVGTNMNNLSCSEYDMIINVLKRDKELRSLEEMRLRPPVVIKHYFDEMITPGFGACQTIYLRQMKQELSYLRKKGALKPGLDASRSCARCVNELGRIINRGALCRLCLKKVCKACRQYIEDDGGWICVFCHKQMQLKAISGEWMKDLHNYSTRKQMEMPPGDELQKVLYQSRRKGLMFESDELENSQPQHSSVLKTFDESFEMPFNETSKNIILGDKASSVAQSVNSTEVSTHENDNQNIHKCKQYEKISPWNGIEAEPTIPVRLLKAPPLGLVAHSECMDVQFPRDRQSSIDGHSTMSIQSQSTSSEILDDNETTAIFCSKRLIPIKKQQAISEAINLQSSSADLTDSGLCSPVLKCDVENAAVHSSSKLDSKIYASNKLEHTQPYKPTVKPTSESSFSESDDDLIKCGIVFRKVTLRKKKSASENTLTNENTSENSTEGSIDPPLSGPTNKRVSNKKCRNTFAKHPKLKSKPISWSFSKNKSCLFNFDGGGKKTVNRLTHTVAWRHADSYSLSPACHSIINPWALEDHSNAQPGDADDDDDIDVLVKQDLVRHSNSRLLSSFLSRRTVIRTPRPRRRSHRSCCKFKHRSQSRSLNCEPSWNWSDDITQPNRSASLPSRRSCSQDWLEQRLWKSHSLDGWMWFMAEQPDHPVRNDCKRRFDRMLPDDYKLVYISSSASSVSDSEEDFDVSAQRDLLRVRSHIQISDGTTYVEDSDWEFNPDCDFKYSTSSIFCDRIIDHDEIVPLSSDRACNSVNQSHQKSRFFDSFLTDLNISVFDYRMANEHFRCVRAVCDLFDIFQTAVINRFLNRIKLKSLVHSCCDCSDLFESTPKPIDRTLFLETLLHAVSAYMLVNRFSSQGLLDWADESGYLCPPGLHEAVTHSSDACSDALPVSKTPERHFSFQVDANIFLFTNNLKFYCIIKVGNLSSMALGAELSLFTAKANHEFRAMNEGAFRIFIPKSPSSQLNPAFFKKNCLFERLRFFNGLKTKPVTIFTNSSMQTHVHPMSLARKPSVFVTPRSANVIYLNKPDTVDASETNRRTTRSLVWGQNALSELTSFATRSANSGQMPDYLYGYSLEKIFSFLLNARKPVCANISLRRDFLLRNQSVLFTLNVDSGEGDHEVASVPNAGEFGGHLLSIGGLIKSPPRQEVWSARLASRNPCSATWLAPSCREDMYSQSANRANDSSAATGLERCASATGVVDPDPGPFERGWNCEVPAPDRLTPFAGRDLPGLHNFGALKRADALYCRHGPPVTSDTEPEVGNVCGGKMSVEPCPLSLVVSSAVGGEQISGCSQNTSTDLPNVTDAEKCFAVSKPIALVGTGTGHYLSLDIYFLNCRFRQDFCHEPIPLQPFLSTFCVASAKPDSQVCSRFLLEGGDCLELKPPTLKQGARSIEGACVVDVVSKISYKCPKVPSIVSLKYENNACPFFNSDYVTLKSNMQETPPSPAQPMENLAKAFDYSLSEDLSVLDHEFCETEQYLLRETGISCVKALSYDNILPCIESLFTGSRESNDEALDLHSLGMNFPQFPPQAHSSSRAPEVSDRVDCSCHRPCEVPLSPTVTSAVVDGIMEVTATEDTEGLSSGDELDKLESDTDSQDTVIEGEAYKRIRSVAIKEKILHANEELFKKCDFTMKSINYASPQRLDATSNSEQKSKEMLPQNERTFTINLEPVSRALPHANESIFFSGDSVPRSIKNESNFPDVTSYASESEETNVDLSKNENSFCSSSETNLYNITGHSLSSPPRNNESISMSKIRFESDDKTPRGGNSNEYHTSSPCLSFREVLYSSESSDNGSDGEEVILSDTSTSSDEASYIAPTAGHMYCGQPIPYGLDTILEESCEESERSSRGGTPTCRDSNDYDHCCNSGRLSRSNSKNSKNNAEKLDARLSEPLLGMKKTTFYDAKCGKNNASNSKLATSRLEKYFKSGLIESKRFSFPEDDLTDESGGVSSDDDDEPQEICPMLPSRSGDKQMKHRTVGLSHEKEASPGSNNCERRLSKTERKKCEIISEYGLEKTNNSETKKTYDKEFFTVFPNKNSLSKTREAYDILQKDYSCSTMSHLSALLLEKFAVCSVGDVDKSRPTTDFFSIQCEHQESKFCKTEAQVKGEGVAFSDCDSVSDEETKNIMSRVLNHIKVDDKDKDSKEVEPNDISPALKILESEIARLMLTVSPVSLSVGEPSSSCSSTIGSNNSDYGSDTLESGEDSATDEDLNEESNPGEQSLLTLASEIEATSPSCSTPPKHAAVGQGKSNSGAISDETLYICKQLMASLKKIADSADATMVCRELCKAESDDHSAKQYIAEQIVSLMQTVNASRNGSPLIERSLLGQPCSVGIVNSDPQDVSDVESPHHNDEKCESSKSKTPSESGSETTISASISIPSYEDSDCTPTESEISHEMDELYALLETNGTSTDLVATRRCRDSDTLGPNEGVSTHAFDSATSDEDESVKQLFPNSRGKDLPSAHKETSLLYGAASHLESLLPITIEERIARYKAAFFSKENEQKNNEVGDSMMRINVILPQPVTPAPNTIGVQRIDNTVIDRAKCSTTNVDSEEVLKLDFGFIHSSKTDGFARTTSSCDTVLTPSERIKCSVTSVKIIPDDNFDTFGGTDATKEGSSQSTCYEEENEALRFENCSKMIEILRTSESNLFNAKESRCGLMTKATNVEEEGEDSSLISPLPKAINPKEKASSENDLLVADYRAKSKENKVSGTKSASNISELESIGNKSSFRDTGYYSFKSSEESILSLDDSAPSRTSTASLTQYRSLTSTETIPEEEESCSKTASSPKISLSSGNIPDAVSGAPTSKSSTLPLSLRGKLTSVPGGNHRARSSFFSTSGVLRKLTLLRDESGNSLRSSPHGRLRVRNRTLSGESEDGKQKKGQMPQISVSECLEGSIGQTNAGSSEKDSVGTQDDDVDQVFTYHSRSQMSLSSFGARSESMTSVYSAAGGGRYGTVTVTGEVLFGLNYNYKTGTLEVHIKECRNLAPVDTKRNRSDPYAKVYLLPDRTKSGKRKTKVKKHTLSPVFDELLRFQVTISELEARTLWLSVWHSDMFGRNDFLGEVMLPLGYDAFEIPGLKWYPLQERLDTIDTPVSYKGDLILALKYVPPDVTSRRHHKRPGDQNKGALHVLVKEARNLMATRSNGTSDPFCKSYLLPDKSKSGKQKTSVLKKTCCPKWNHTFVYDDVTLAELRERCLELTIWDYDKITSNDFLGGVRLSLGSGKYQGRDVDWMDSVGEEVSLWYTMLDRPNMWVDGSLLLRPTMQNRRP